LAGRAIIFNVSRTRASGSTFKKGDCLNSISSVSSDGIGQKRWCGAANL